MVDKKYFSISLISIFAISLFSGLVSAGWWEDFQNSIHLSPGCTLPSASSGQFACTKGAVRVCNSGTWTKVNDCSHYVTTSFGFIDPCANSVARSSELLARNDCSECGGQSEKCCVGNLQCRGSLICQSGYCTAAATCTNDCSSNGQRECFENGVKVCSNYDSDTCLEWGPLTYCPTGTACQSGQCVVTTTCTNDCTSSGYSECTAGNTGRKTCGNFDSDSCLEWSSTALCSPGQTCISGECYTPSNPPTPPPATCTNECTSSGVSECSGNGRRTCGNYDSDTCLEWGSIALCSTGKICINGECYTQSSAGCTNECNSGAVQCTDDYYYKKCGNYDTDSCTEWSTSSFACGSNKACSNNQCITKTCLNDCTPSGKSECVGSYARKTCGNFDSDSCLEWSSTALCSPGQTCYSGECATPSSPPAPQTACLNDCPTSGKSECVGANARRTCGHYDSDTCLEWSSTIFCQSGQTCLSDGDCHTISTSNRAANSETCTSEGTIQNGKYCSAGLIWETQKGQGYVCESNFECITNACYSGRCASAGFAEWLRNVFRNLFG